MKEIYEGSVAEDNPGKWERALFTLLYAFFLSLCAAHFDSGSDQIGLVFGFMGYPLISWVPLSLGL